MRYRRISLMTMTLFEQQDTIGTNGGGNEQKESIIGTKLAQLGAFYLTAFNVLGYTKNSTTFGERMRETGKHRRLSQVAAVIGSPALAILVDTHLHAFIPTISPIPAIPAFFSGR